LENYYCAAPLCASSRISFATSTYVGERGHRNYGSEISSDIPKRAARFIGIQLEAMHPQCGDILLGYNSSGPQADLHTFMRPWHK
jgi:hypothetical protein